MKTKDAFEALSLTDQATPEEVKDRWKALAKEHHPDRGGDAVRFHELHQCFMQAMAYAKAPKRCDACNGKGHRVVQQGFQTTRYKCTACAGTGKK